MSRLSAPFRWSRQLVAMLFSSSSIAFFDRMGKLFGGLVAIIAMIGFTVPPAGDVIAAVTAWRLGYSGYVYYEVTEDREITDSGQLYLIKPGSGAYEEIGFGDKLRASSAVNFRMKPTTDSPVSLVIGTNECVTVLSKAKNEKLDMDGYNGWLWVTTSPCGIFG